MAAKEMYDYLSTVTPDYSTTTLNITPHGELQFVGRKSQHVHQFDDGSQSTVAISNTPYFDVSIRWDILTASDAGTVMDFYFDSNKANAMERSFYWLHPVDGHTYVVKFASEFTGVYKAGWPTKQQLPGFNLRVIGRKAD